MKTDKQKAFNLAEVLITLGIIGIVAMITIPTLIKNIQEAEYKTAYKKAYSAGFNAYRMSIAKGETFNPTTSYMDGANACVNWQIFSSQFKKTKECNSNNNSQCWDVTGESSNTGPSSDALSFIDVSGNAWSMRGPCSTAGAWYTQWFLVDTNGFKKPNKFGKDRWAFQWVMDNSTWGNVTNFASINTDYTGGASINGISCPTGPCYYKSWLME